MRLGLAVASVLAASACVRSSPPPPAALSRTPVAAPAPAPADAFKRDVAPILARTCAPCHNPGGKMYDKLPFDDAATVRGHREGILRRLKGDDHAAVARWLEGP
jgi:hypothetical protein